MKPAPKSSSSQTDREADKERLQRVTEHPEPKRVEIVQTESEGLNTDVEHARFALATRFRSAIEEASVGMIMTDAAGAITMANREVERLFGYTEIELLGRSIEVLVPENLRSTHVTWREQYSLAHEPRRMGVGRDLTGLRKDGSEFWIEASISPIRTDDGVVTLAMISDISERKRAEVELRRSEERIRAILDAAVDGLVTIDATGKIITFNRAAERIFGYTASEIQGQNVRCLVPAGLHERYDKYFARFQTTNVAQIVGRTRNLIACRKNGATFPIQVNVCHVEDGNLYVGSVRDMSEHQALQEDVLRIASLEQRRIGQELHDATQQELTGLGLMAQSLAERLRRTNNNEALTMAARLAKGIERANLNVQFLARGLVPTTIDRRSLMTVLAELAANMQLRSGLSCRFECSQPVFFDNDETATHLFRIAQEAISNATKHAHAKSLVIQLKRGDADVTLQVSDDGVGIRPEKTATVGVGLRLMAYRSAVIGGVLTVKRNTGGGTTVTCTVPRIGHEPKSIN